MHRLYGAADQAGCDSKAGGQRQHDRREDKRDQQHRVENDGKAKEQQLVDVKQHGRQRNFGKLFHVAALAGDQNRNQQHERIEKGFGKNFGGNLSGGCKLRVDRKPFFKQIAGHRLHHVAAVDAAEPEQVQQKDIQKRTAEIAPPVFKQQRKAAGKQLLKVFDAE